jgi:WD40 repeat protein
MMEVYVIEVLKERLYNKIPLIGGWLRRKAAGTLSNLLREGNERAAAMLAEAITHSDDKKVCRIAVDALSQIKTQPCVDAVVAGWVETRHLTLTNLLVEHKWIGSAPMKTRVLSALKVGKLALIREGGADVVEPLVYACEDFDPDISGRARQLLTQLHQEDAKEALCRFVIDHDHPVALEAALAIGYLPRDISQRALFLFLTEQWERYETLDFDHYLLSTAHRIASPELRQRIANKLRAAGRIDFLTVLAGADYYSRAADMTPGETEVLVQILFDKREWAKLWQLVFEIPFIWSIQIINILNREGWKPERGDEQTVFEELSALAEKQIVTSEEEVRQVIPLALQEATIRVKGRVNNVAFSPIHPVIAIGTGNRKVGVWNFQRGEMEQVFEGLNHSVGLVTFLPDGTLLCAERTSALNDPCAIYVCRDHETVCLGQHEGSVTAIEAVGETQLLSTGRDQKIMLWDVPKARKVKEENMTFWARAAKVSSDGQHVALLHEGVTLMNVPNLKRIVNWPKSSVGRCAAFIPNESALVVGKSNGQVLIYEYAKQSLPWEYQSLEHHDRRVQGVAALIRNSTIITAGSEGKLHFTNWAERKYLGKIKVANGSFTSLHTSPDGTFMATGDSGASMSLWDLRVLDIPKLFTSPFAQALPDLLVTIHELATNPKLDPNVRQSLTFIQRVLGYRFRFDIEIDEVPAIKVGEFDIEIE